MGKRSNFKRRRRDAYFTTLDGAEPVFKYLQPGQRYIEPCAGRGDLIDHLRLRGLECGFAGDVLPIRGDVEWFNALDFDALCALRLENIDYIITNPPWERTTLHQMIIAFASLKPTWFLFDAGWPFTQQSAKMMPWCKKIVPAGRPSWMRNGVGGKDDCAWYLFDKNNKNGTRFMRRAV